MGFRWECRDAFCGLVRSCRGLSGVVGIYLEMPSGCSCRPKYMLLTCVYSFRPSMPFSRPMPLLLTPPERGARDRLLVGVDPDRACLQRPADTPGFLEVFRPDATGQPECRAIGLVDQIGFIAKRESDQHRAKGFFLASGRPGIKTIDHRGKVISPGGEFGTRRHLASAEHLRPFGAGARDKPDHPFAVPQRCQGAHFHALV